MAYGEQESPDMAGMGQEGAAAASGSTQDGSEGAKVEITLCVYQDGTLALRVDDGEKVPVESLDQAIAGIKAFAEQEQGEGLEGEQTEAKLGTGGAESEGGEFEAGFNGVRGGGMA